MASKRIAALQKMLGPQIGGVFGQSAMAPRPTPKRRFTKNSGRPAKGPSVSDAGLMNSSSSGTAEGPSYQR